MPQSPCGAGTNFEFFEALLFFSESLVRVGFSYITEVVLARLDSNTVKVKAFLISLCFLGSSVC